MPQIYRTLTVHTKGETIMTVHRRRMSCGRVIRFRLTMSMAEIKQRLSAMGIPLSNNMDSIIAGLLPNIDYIKITRNHSGNPRIWSIRMTSNYRLVISRKTGIPVSKLDDMSEIDYINLHQQYACEANFYY